MFGALMDEYARAAEDFCRVVDWFDASRFDGERAGELRDDQVAAHYVRRTCAGRRTATRTTSARRAAWTSSSSTSRSGAISSPRDVRRLLAEGIMFTEATVEPLRNSSEDESRRSRFRCAGARDTTPNAARARNLSPAATQATARAMVIPPTRAVQD